MAGNFAWLKDAVLTMGARTTEAVDLAVQSLVASDAATAARAREIEKQVDAMYYGIDEYCLEALAAGGLSREDVNLVVSSLKIAMELERTCDYANQIAKMVQRKFASQDMKPLAPLHGSLACMKDQSLEMLRGALECFRCLDCELTQQVIAKDTKVDKSNRDLFRDMVCVLSVHPWAQETIMDYHVAIRYVERVGDRATNVAELVFYIVHGEPMKKKAAGGGEANGG